jgi:hypothetical protein
MTVLIRAPAPANCVEREDRHTFALLSADGLLLQEIGFCHIRISDGVNSRLQLSGLLAKLCKLTLQARR